MQGIIDAVLVRVICCGLRSLQEDSPGETEAVQSDYKQSGKSFQEEMKEF